MPQLIPPPRTSTRDHRSCWGALFRILAFACSFLFDGVLQTQAADAEPAATPTPQPAWGRIVPQTNPQATVRLEVRAWPADGKLPLPTPFPNITAARLVGGRQRQSLKWVFNADATQLHLESPVPLLPPLPATILLDAAKATGQLADGRIIFSALDAWVQGNRAKLESHPSNHRIGFWTDPADSVTWNYKPTRWGMYDLDLTFSAAGGEGTELQFDIAGQTFTVTRPSTAVGIATRRCPLAAFTLRSPSQQRQRLLKDAWLTHVGHVRPGMNKGKPLADAQREAAALTERLDTIR